MFVFCQKKFAWHFQVKFPPEVRGKFKVLLVAVEFPRSVHTMRFFLHFCLQFAPNAKNVLYTLSLRLTQHPIDVMLQFDANTHANVKCE